MGTLFQQQSSQQPAKPPIGFLCSDAFQRRMSVTITTPASTLRLTPLRVTELLQGLQTSPLPPPRARDPEVAHAPVRTHNLTTEEQRLAVRNALRYFPPSTHAELAPEFAQELAQYGHIYMYRFMPNQPLHAVPADKNPLLRPERSYCSCSQVQRSNSCWRD